MGMGFHAGEVKAQQLAGVRVASEFANKMYRDFIPQSAESFLEKLQIIYVGSMDNQGRVWCSLVSGQQGFLSIRDNKTLVINGNISKEDPLITNIESNSKIGTLYLDFATRRRLRINGTASLEDGVIILDTNQVYGNCPKYIQTRTFSYNEPDDTGTTNTKRATNLSQDQKNWIEQSDTFFIASTNNDEMDASHRGGNPGFVKILENGAIVFPDYFGNFMFNTLGNIVINPNVGLVFIDFENRKTLQITGKATILWDEKGSPADFPGSERLVVVHPEEIVETKNALEFSAKLVELSPFNPK